MARVYRTLRVTTTDEGVLGVVIDAPPMNLIGPELVRDLVMLIGALESCSREFLSSNEFVIEDSIPAPQAALQAFCVPD